MNSRQLARAMARPMARQLVSTSVSYDSDAQAWFAAVAANGGQLYSSGYSESVTKLAFSNFFKELKTQALWPLLSELAVFGVGVGNLAAGMVKMKNAGTPLMTNNNFAPGDLTPNGATCGLKGDGTTKWINVNLLASLISSTDGSTGCYQTLAGVAANSRFIASTTSFGVNNDDAGRLTGLLHSSNSAIMAGAGVTNGIKGVTRLSANLTVFTRLASESTTAVNSPETDGISLFRRFAGLAYSSASLSAYWAGANLDATNRAALSTALNNLHAAFGFTP